MKKTILRRILKWLGYSLFSLGCFIFFFFLTFPFSVFESRISSLVKTHLGADLKIGQLSSYWVTGLSVSGVEITTGRPHGGAAGEGTEGAEDGAGGVAVKLDQVRLRVSILPLAFGKTVVSFYVRAFGGEMAGSVEKSGRTIKLEAKAEGLQVARLLAAKSGLNVSAAGAIAAEVSFVLPEKSMRGASGHLTLSGSNLSIEKGEVSGYELPKLAIGDLSGKISIDKGRAALQDFKAKSQDMEGSMDGYVLLNQNLPLSTARIQVKVKPTQEYIKSNKMIGTLLSFLSKARTREGSYGFTIYGPLRSLSGRQG